MGYVAVRGGAEAIANAESLLATYRRGGTTPPLQVGQIVEQMRLAVDRVMAEGSLYAPTLAALAIKQAERDLIEAAFLLRAYRSTLARLDATPPLDTAGMRLIRRISSAFKDVPGGQMLGPTRDYTQRLLDFSLLDEAEGPCDPPRVDLQSEPLTERPAVEKVSTFLRREGLLAAPGGDGEAPVDVTRQIMRFPLPRSARLQVLARGEEGGILMLAYSSMRGFGNVHPTVAELRVGHVPVSVRVPGLDEPVVIGEVLATEVEMIGRYGRCGEAGEGPPAFTLGYGFAFGHNERRAITMAVLDRALMAETPTAPVEDQEFVLLHIDGIEAQGFANHWKLPHYVDFQSELDRLRAMREQLVPADGCRAGAALARPDDNQP
jgi:alpha-D-ribose 1-methylphosphonate 5-triphosphate synthase subunit PhnI